MRKRIESTEGSPQNALTPELHKPSGDSLNHVPAMNQPVSLPDQQGLKKGPPEPTTTELAMIAAVLSQDGSLTWSRLPAEAYNLWEACAKEIRGRAELRRDRYKEICDMLPQPKEYPVSFETFLELVLPGRRRADRERAYRHFLMDWKKVNLMKAGDLLTEHKKQAAEKMQFSERAYLFQAWLNVDFFRSKRLAGLKGAGRLTLKQSKLEQKETAQKRRKAIAVAYAKWEEAVRTFLRSMVV